MSSFWWGQSALDELIEKATSELLPAGQVDLALHLEISDQIRSKKVNAKDAMKSLKQRLSHKNPNVILATLSLVDTCMKNSGSGFVKEVATREFMEEVTHLIKVPTGCNQDVKQKVLYLIQVWGIASKGNPSLSYISGTYSLLRAEGYVFPPITERIDSILLETAVAPEWTDSDCCERCRTSFTLTNRKHHCRQCGATFCQQCSSKSIPLPHLGINDTVRVCDGCYIKVKLAKVADKDAVPHLLGTPPSISSSLAPTFTPSIKNKSVAETNINTSTTTATATANGNDDQFEDDLKKAIEMSLKESEQQSKISNYFSKKDDVKKSTEEEEEDANLAAAIAASLKDMNSTLSYSQSNANTRYNNNELSPIDMENIQLFSTLMQRVRSLGGDISGDTQINKLYTQIGALQPKLVKTLDETCQKHDTFVSMHEKLNRAVKAYDKLLEERLSNASQRTYNRSNSINNNNMNVPYTPYYGSYNASQPQQQQQQQSNITYPVASHTYNQYSNPSPLPQTPALQQNYSYPNNNYIPQQQQSVQQTPVIQNQQVVQQTPVIHRQSYTIPTSNQANTPSLYQPQYGIQHHNEASPVAPVLQQNTSDTHNQQYNYPSVPTTAPSANNNRYYENTVNQQSQYNSYYPTPTPQGSTLQQTNHNQPAAEEAPLIEL